MTRIVRTGTALEKLRPNEHLIGRENGRWRLNTPALVLDIEPFERNLEKMAQHCHEQRIALRPHAKTHKSVEIARRQQAAGAIGICCAKLGEAEILAAGGIPSILITSPVVTAEGGRRLVALNATLHELLIVMDARANLPVLAAAAAESGRTLRVLLDLEVGLMRTGAQIGEQAYAIASDIADDGWLEFAGVQAYAGHLMHVEGEQQRTRLSLAAMKRVAIARDELTRRNLAPKVISGGGTGTFDIDPKARTLTELQAGSYLFMDRQYNDVWMKANITPPFEPSLFVQTTVISANCKGQVTTDAGLKAFSTDADAPIILSGAPDGSTYLFLGDEQGGVSFQNATDTLRPGAVLTCISPHCDPTVNLYDYFHVVRGDELIDIWRVDARGASQ